MQTVTSSTTSVARSRRAITDPVADRDDDPNRASVDDREAASATGSPKISAARRIRARRQTASLRPFKAIGLKALVVMATGNVTPASRVRSQAIPTPAAQPVAATSAFSMSASHSRSPGEAPSEVRTATSRAR